MKILRLSPQDARTWRENRSVLVDESGDFIRHIEISETRVLSELQKKSRQTRQPMEHEFKHVMNGREVTSRIAVSFKEIAPRTTVMVSTVDGKQIVEGREFFQRQVLKVHGECQLRTHTGQFMRAVRDPNQRRPTAKDANRNAPRPEHCKCKDWGQPHVGRHHTICEWNSKAPLEEQALPNDETIRGSTMNDQKILPDMRPMEKPSILEVKTRKNAAESGITSVEGVPISTPIVTIPSPDTCQCEAFSMPDGSPRPKGVHHPLCQYREAWEARSLPKMVLVNLNTGEVSRAATADEIREASGDKPYIVIGEDQYGVVPEEEVRKKIAAAE